MSASMKLREKIAAAIREKDGDHTLGASALAEIVIEVLIAENTVAIEVGEQRERNHAKHGDKSIEGKHWMYAGWMPTLMEEVGEIARAYQDASPVRLRAEALDTLAVCWMLIDSIDQVDSPTGPQRTFEERMRFEREWDARVEAYWEREGKPDPAQQRGGYPGESIVGTRKIE